MPADQAWVLSIGILCKGDRHQGQTSLSKLRAIEYITVASFAHNIWWYGLHPAKLWRLGQRAGGVLLARGRTLPGPFVSGKLVWTVQLHCCILRSTVCRFVESNLDFSVWDAHYAKDRFWSLPTGLQTRVGWACCQESLWLHLHMFDPAVIVSQPNSMY